jgi:hypothetical protein
MANLTWYLVSLLDNSILDKFYGSYDEAYRYFDSKDSLHERINYSVDIVSSSKYHRF